MPDYSIIEDCVLTPGSIDCLSVKWADYSPSYGDWTPCQCCKWWDEFSYWDEDEDVYAGADLEIVDTEEEFNDCLRVILGMER